MPGTVLGAEDRRMHQTEPTAPPGVRHLAGGNIMPTANIQRAECGQNTKEGLTGGGEASREGFLGEVLAESR